MRLLEPTQLDDPALRERGAHCVDYVRNCMTAPGLVAIRNVRTGMQVLDTGRHLFPVSINAGGELADNSYVVSPLTTYTGYAQEEIIRLEHPVLTWPLRALVSAMGHWLAAAQIDRLVQVNNWLLSTNAYPPDWQGEDLADITTLLRNRWPDHAICFRSLNRFSNALLIERLEEQGYLAIPSRQVYVFDGRPGPDASFLKHHNVRLDAALLRRTPYRVVSGDALDDREFERLEQLYNQLYLDKYCHLNPQFSADWLRCGQRDGWLDLRVLQTQEGRIDGVLGWFNGHDRNVLTTPMVGYDTGLPQKLGLYRLLTYLCLREAANRKTVLNFSSGAASFKRLRGGQAEIEYSMVYVRHLPRRRQRIWHVLGAILQGVGVPIMKKFKL